MSAFGYVERWNPEQSTLLEEFGKYDLWLIAHGIIIVQDCLLSEKPGALMATFRYYNIQLLPINTEKTEFPGVEGYKRLFQWLKDKYAEAIAARKLDAFAFPLRNEMNFAPFQIMIHDEYSCGTFVKFDIAKEVTNLYTNEQLYSGSSEGTAHPFHFRFVFDYERHILAIEDTKGRLPAPTQVMKAFEFFFKKIVMEEFPDHRLDVEQLSSDKELGQILREASGFKRVFVELTFSNSDKYLDEYLDELEEKNIHHTEHEERGFNNEPMTSPSKFAVTMLGAARKYGNAIIRYIEKNNDVERVRNYQMRDHPIRIPIHDLKDVSDDEMWDKIKLSIPRADELARQKLPDLPDTYRNVRRRKD